MEWRSNDGQTSEEKMGFHLITEGVIAEIAPEDQEAGECSQESDRQGYGLS